MTDAMQQVLSAAELDERYQPNIARATLCVDSELVVEIEHLEEQLEEAKVADEQLNRPPQAPEIARRIIELRESDRAKAAVIEVRFRGIGRGAYRRLIEAHKPTEAQLSEADDNKTRRPDWDPDTFWPALCAKACVNPTGTDESWWARKFDDWDASDVALVQSAARAAQEAYMELPKAEAAYELTGTSRTKKR